MNLSVAARPDAVFEASIYQRPHEKYVGKFAVWRDHSRGQRKDMRQEFYDVADLVQALTSLDPAWDTYLSQGTFRSNRRWVTNLGRICLHFIDLDTYRIPGLAGKTAEQLAELVLQVCADLGIPEPTVIMSSGRGLYVKWATTGALPQDMLPRWNEVQKTLAAALEALGADIAATDAARLLRVAQTTNSRNGQIARVLHLATGVDGGPLLYQWDQFCDTILPVERRVLEEKRRKRGPVQLALIPGEGDLTERARSNWRRVNWRRWKDLDTLVELRGGVAEGQRMQMLMWQTNFLLASGATNPAQMWGEVANVASRIDPNWHYRKAELGTLFRKAKAQLRGEFVIYQGKTWTPLYTPRTDTLVRLFQITDVEQQQMATLVGPELKRERRHEGWRTKREKKRRNEGAQLRQEYLRTATNDELRARVRQLAAGGLSQRQIAADLSVSRARVQQILRESKGG